jgi:outer membrane protein
MDRRYKTYLGSILLFLVGVARSYGQSSQTTPNSHFPEAAASASTTLTLAQAEAIAVANQPRLLAAQLRTRAAGQRVREPRSGLFPTIGFNATGVAVADTGTSTAAGALTPSSISDRFAYGGNLVQLVTDFGRTSALSVRSAYFRLWARRRCSTLQGKLKETVS